MEVLGKYYGLMMIHITRSVSIVNPTSQVLALWILLYFANSLGLKILKVFGDSKVVINWINGVGKLQVIMLRNWLNKIKEMTLSFDSITYEHTYRELNMVADALSKFALELQDGTDSILFSRMID